MVRLPREAFEALEQARDDMARLGRAGCVMLRVDDCPCKRPSWRIEVTLRTRPVEVFDENPLQPPDIHETMPCRR